jgi:plasmid maintenance system killer protein
MWTTGSYRIYWESSRVTAKPGTCTAFRLHPLKGSRKGVWAVTVRANWRVTFRFEGGDAYDVDLEDYH